VYEAQKHFVGEKMFHRFIPYGTQEWHMNGTWCDHCCGLAQTHKNWAETHLDGIVMSTFPLAHCDHHWQHVMPHMCALFGTSHRLAAYKQAGNEARCKYKLVDAIRVS